MSSGRSDASTSTDDFKRPLSLFYLSAPCGVLCHSPPRLLATGLSAGAVPPDLWAECTSPAPAPAPGSAMRAYPRPPTDLWLECSSPSPPLLRVHVAPRRAPPARQLPPLCLPAPAPLTDSSDDAWWPRARERFHLPPLEQPTPTLTPAPVPVPAQSVSGCGRARRVGVHKRTRRPGHSPAARALTRRIRRAVTEEHRPGASPALRRALRTLRAAWPPARAPCTPARARAYSCTGSESPAPTHQAPPAALAPPSMVRVASPAASPGLLRRRYSVPETVMRKYRLAQQSSEPEDCGASRTSSPGAGAGGGGGERQARRDLVRRSALLRRLCGRANACCCLPAPPPHTTQHAHQPPSLPCLPSLPSPSSPPTSPSPPQLMYETLEVVVSSRSSPPPVPLAPPPPAAPPGELDRYVSRVLLASLSSLGATLERGLGGGGGVLEKEIKIRLQHAAVNTVVHLSPTSNHQIIFGNEELGHSVKLGYCEETRGGEEPGQNEDLDHSDELGHNGHSSHNEELDHSEEFSRPEEQCHSVCNTDLLSVPDGPCGVNKAVLQQIQKLFRSESPDSRPDDERQLHYEHEHENQSEESRHPTHSSGHEHGHRHEPLGGVRAGNYCPPSPARLVPRYSARPHSDSMEVLTSDDTASLPDSLDEPPAPAPPARPRALVRSAVDVLALLPERAPSPPPAPPPPPPQAYFVRMDGALGEGGAPRLPERLRARLARRPRPRPRSRPRARPRPRPDGAALLDALLDDVIRGIARDELRAWRISRAVPPPAHSAPSPQVRGRLQLQARAERGERGAGGGRRVYHKSELRAGGRCVEILEILEYVSSPQSSAEADEPRAPRRSRIPVRLRAPPVAPTVPAAPAPPAHSRSSSRRFRQVFPDIPEEHPPAAPPPRRHRAPAPAPVAAWARAGGKVSSSDSDVRPRETPAPTTGASKMGAAVERRSAGTQYSPAPLTPPPQAPPALPRAAPPPPPRAPHITAGVGVRGAGHGGADSSGRAGGPSRSSSSSSSSGGGGGGAGGGGTLCGAWLAAGRRRRRARRHRDRDARTEEEENLSKEAGNSQATAHVRTAAGECGAGAGAGAGWSVTLCGGARTQLPRDVEMRLRFPTPPPANCAPAPAPAPAPALALRAATSSRTQHSVKKSSDSLPELSYRTGAERARAKRSVKTRRACSLHCWLPPAVPPLSDALSVLGCGIVPTRRPRAPRPPRRPTSPPPAPRASAARVTSPTA